MVSKDDDFVKIPNQEKPTAKFNCESALDKTNFHQNKFFTTKLIVMKAIFILLLVTITANTFCQQTSPVTKSDDLQKSRHQKTAAWIMLGGGLALAVGGAAVDASNWYSSGGDVMLIAGGASMLGSIPLFIASSKNKKRANRISAFFKVEKLRIAQQTVLSTRLYPALSIKVGW